MIRNDIIDWLLQGDISIQYQVHRDLLGNTRPDFRARIASQGWGAKFLSQRFPDGHWGQKFYQPKWTSTHYTLFDLRNLCIAPGNSLIRKSIDIILKNEKANDGGILPTGANQVSDQCINGMFLNYASYFNTNERDLNSVVDCMLTQMMPDGGFNCRLNRSGARHSSLHTTLSVLEGLTEYERNGYMYQLEEVQKAIRSSQEFILLHQLFLSDRTGKIINKDFLKLSYPRRWRYDILSALDYFQHAKVPWDDCMQPAIDILLKKQKQKWHLECTGKTPWANPFRYGESWKTKSVEYIEGYAGS